MASWLDVEQWCLIAIEYWKLEWKVDVPPRQVPEPEELYKEIGIACLKLLANPKAKHDFGHDVNCWVLARLLFAAGFCRNIATRSPRFQPADIRSALKIILLGDWKDRPEGAWR